MAQPIPLQEILQQELQPGERVIWEGQPSPTARMKSGYKGFLLSALFAAVGLFFMLGPGLHGNSHHSGRNEGMIAIGAIYFLLSIPVMLIPLRIRRVAQHTLYVITDRRAILLNSFPRRTIQSIRGERLITIVRQEDETGRGEILFEREAVSGKNGRTTFRNVGFFDLPDVKAVEGLLQQTYEATRVASPTASAESVGLSR